MNELYQPGLRARRAVLRVALGGAGIVVLGPARADESIVVTIDNFTFSPAELRIRAGTSVTWTNRDDIPHTIVLPKLNTRSKTINTDESYLYRFEKAGSFDYMCGLHPHMKGKVVVEG